jgi:hypothetical protein
MPAMDAIRFASIVRFWSPDKASGLAVADIPAEHHAALGGLRQQRVAGTVNGAPFTSNVMPAGGGRLALSVSKAMQQAARAGVGEAITVEITMVGRADP